ncbi:hypothetical protein ABID95_005854 [Streptomyces atratus]
MAMSNHTSVIAYVQYAFHLLALSIVTGLIVAVIRELRRAR